MFEMNTVKGSTNSVSQILFRQSSVWLHNSALAVSPLRFNRIEPGTFDGQEADQDTNTLSRSFDSLIVFTDPGAHGFAGVPASIVPDHRQNRLAQFFNFLATPLQKLNGYVTNRSSINETQKHFLKSQIIAGHPSQKDAVTSQRFWIGVIFLLGLFHQSQWLSVFTPTRQVRLGKTAPPDFILKTPYPTIFLRQRNYSVARLFLRSYAGSGLVIQCLARFQETFNCFRAYLTQSPLTWRGVMPSAKLTSAASSSVHTLVS